MFNFFRLRPLSETRDAGDLLLYSVGYSWAMGLRNLAVMENVPGKRIISEIANHSHLSLNKYRHCRSWQKAQWSGSQESGDQGLESATYFCMALGNNFHSWALATKSEKQIGPDEWFINCSRGQWSQGTRWHSTLSPSTFYLLYKLGF